VIIIDLEWDDENVEHIARHAVNPGEVEDACFGTHLSRSAGGQRYVISGQTAGGRYLNVVIERVGRGMFRTITAFEMSEDYRRRYRKRLGR
jgi:uncharacterized DUF497 family protein